MQPNTIEKEHVLNWDLQKARIRDQERPDSGAEIQEYYASCNLRTSRAHHADIFILSSLLSRNPIVGHLGD